MYRSKSFLREEDDNRETDLFGVLGVLRRILPPLGDLLECLLVVELGVLSFDLGELALHELVIGRKLLTAAGGLLGCRLFFGHSESYRFRLDRG